MWGGCRGLYQRAVCEGNAGVLGLGTAGAHAEEGVALGGCGRAARGVAGAAGCALAAGDAEGADDEVAGLDGRDGLTHLDDGSDVLVAHALLVDGLSSAVGP